MKLLSMKTALRYVNAVKGSCNAGSICVVSLPDVSCRMVSGIAYARRDLLAMGKVAQEVSITHYHLVDMITSILLVKNQVITGFKSKKYLKDCIQTRNVQGTVHMMRLAQVCIKFAQSFTQIGNTVPYCLFDYPNNKKILINCITWLS